MSKKDRSMLNPLSLIDLVKEANRNGWDGGYVMIISVLLALYTAIASMPALLLFALFANEPFFNYSNGTIKAKTTKISAKGLFWTTNEGYVLTGSISEGVAEKWKFSTQSQDVIECFNNNDNVELTYRQYLLVPFSVGSQSHIVTGCRPLK